MYITFDKATYLSLLFKVGLSPSKKELKALY